MIGRRGLALGAGAIIALAACGSSGGGSSNKGTIKIGVELPESGKEASNGIPTLNGVKYAVQKQTTIKGFTIEINNLDDAVNGVHDAQKGAQNVQQFVSDSKVLGFVGPFNSAVAQAEIPVANAAHLTMISPANTNECLTKDLPAPECTFKPADLRPSGPNNYFRVAATDDFQGPAMADYAYDTLGLKKVAVASDNETYGKGIADSFSRELTKKGGDPTPRQDFDTKTTNSFKPFESSATAAGGLYFGGTDSNKVCIARQQMKSAGFNAPFFGGDGIVTAQCITDAADNVDNMYGTVAAADATQIPDAKSTIDDFKKNFSATTDFGAYTMPAYDCANILLDGISKAIDDAGGNMPTREQVRARVAQTKDFPGVLGKTSFDSNGDTSNKIISIYTIGAAPGLTGSTPKDWIWKAQVKF
ncbi:MAG TPA: branched-chain amino acid ABC transporter substrate-binding protein [Candidatus Dormibacteraeota bacterium]|jgi:branched-chain amino acid transport system substrate-binding protein|nr:branched-chain amino acid ABC transporter substrate-binding protein [Candidatus Dormibacteraeota bacterium]